MKTKDGPSVSKKIKGKLKGILLVGAFFGIMIYAFSIYHSIQVIPVEKASIEVGSEDVDVQTLIKEINGEVLSIKQDVDPNTLGEQEVIFEVKKDNIIRDVPMTVSVVDSIAPVIELASDTVTITKGDSYDLKENIQTVSDSFYGDLEYSDKTNQSKLMAYNIQFNGDMEDVGDHEVTVLAVDKSGNIASQSYTLSVVEPEPEPDPEPVYYYQPIYYDLPANPSGSDLVSIAYSYLGYPYGPGNYPGAFDCSGFVQFVYSQVGISISRSTSTQIYDGSPVSYDSMQPGDIIVWGYGWDSPTHSAMYVGDGMMIHSANYGTGVILSDIQGWLNGSGTQIVTIRRI